MTRDLLDTSNRDAGLDAVRGLAILMVLCTHYFRFSPDTWLWAALNSVFKSSWLGVDLFFSLSGFLITRILIQSREQEHYFRNFYARRALRIFPAYYLYLIFVFFLFENFELAVSAAELQPWKWPLLCYVQNIVMTIDGTHMPWRGLDHLWSLAVEEQFYLFWPLVVFMSPTRLLPRICIALIALAWICKFVLLAATWKFAAYGFTVSRLDALAAGAWIACWTCSRQSPSDSLPRYARIASFLAALFLTVHFVRGRGLGLTTASNIALITSAASLAFAGLIYLVASGNDYPAVKRLFDSRGLRFLGRYSYGLYLIHIAWAELALPAVQRWLESTTGLGDNWVLLISGIAVISLAIVNAVVLYHVYEAPILSLKKFFPQPTPSRLALSRSNSETAVRP